MVHLQELRITIKGDEMEIIRECFKSTSIIKKVFIVGLILGLMTFLMFFFVKGLRAEDMKQKKWY